MKTGIILIGIALIIFIVLSLISRLQKQDIWAFEITDLIDFHIGEWFYKNTEQLIYRIALLSSFCLFAAGMIVFSLNYFPEWGMDWYRVIMRLMISCSGGIVVGYILCMIANAVAFGLVFVGNVPSVVFDWLRGQD